MTENRSTEPATDAGHTEPAGAGLSDDAMARDVASETDPNQDAEDVFARESDGTDDDTEAGKSDADELR